jgi:Protein of unknown function (DUF3307)
MHLSTQTIVGLTGNILVMPRSFDPATPLRAVVFVVALVVLLVAHQVGDHVIQTDHQAAGKAGPGLTALWAMLGHLAGYHAVAAVLLVGTFAVLGLPLTWWGVLAGVAFSALTHAALDRRWPVRAILRRLGSPQFAESTGPVCGMYAADHALHQLSLLGSALLIAGL